MANKIKIGNLEISAFKLGTNDCKIYLGSIKLYPQDSHDYSQDYLTFRVTEGGTILWKKIGSVAKTISYSVDDGETWTEITASSAGTAINVSAGDKVLFKGVNSKYANDKNNYSGFDGGTAKYDVEGNIMSLVSGDSFTQATAFTSTYVFCSLFKQSNAVSAKNLVMPVMALTDDCYRAMFSKAHCLEEAPELPATTLSKECYWYMFEECPITKAPDLPAETLGAGSYGNMFINCSNLNYIKCIATNISASSSTTNWVSGVAATGTFIKTSAMTSWTIGKNGIPTGWVVYDYDGLMPPIIEYNGVDTISLSCETTSSSIYYRLDEVGNYTLYTEPIVITADTVVEAYSEKNGNTSTTVSQKCVYVSDIPFEESNRDLDTWTYRSQEIEVPYSVNAIDGHSASYAKGNFDFETSFGLREAQPTYLWFEHADQSADIYINNTKVETHWGGYNAFFTDVTDYVESGMNEVKVELCNTTRSTLAPCAGDFNFNATLGYVKLFTSPYLPSTEYGYDGFHVVSNVSDTAATVTVKTSVPTGATVVCTIDDGTYHYSDTGNSTGDEMQFTTTITNPHLWNGTLDPHLYTITLEIYHDGELYHRYERPYGLRYYEYVINDTEKVGTAQDPYTGFLLNGSPYLLRGVCMHNDLAEKANALTTTDIANDFEIVQELGCNFLRLVHYPHPKAVYDWCDRLGIIVETEVPWVNNAQSSQPADYYDHLTLQYEDMVKQHYNHPSIMFWCLANEITTDTPSTIKTKIDSYTSTIKALDSERLVGFVVSHNIPNPSDYFNNPSVDWYGCNTYVGWYIDKNTNNPTNQINTRINNVIVGSNKALALSEYGGGGTQDCHSDDPQSTTTRGNNPRHDIEYQMWLHEGHLAAIKNFPQLMFTAEWQLFDVAVSKRNEGYVVCLDGENTYNDSELRRLNNKGIVERDHVTKKDTFYLYKAEWSDEKFVHICGKSYTKRISRAIKCYTNDGNLLSLYVNNAIVDTAAVLNHIATFATRTFDEGDVIRVEGSTANDTFTFGIDPVTGITATFYVTNTSVPTQILYKDALVDGTSGFSAIEIDGELQQTVESAYTFSETGEHVVKYRLVDDTTVGAYAFANCSNLISVKIPGTVTTISEGILSGCTNLTRVNIPSGVTVVSENVFSNCTGLEHFIIPNNVTTINDNAFSNCSSLTSCTIGTGVTVIGSDVFYNCSNLGVIISEPASAPSIESDTFTNIMRGGLLFVPTSNSSYDVWMGATADYLGYYDWTLNYITSGAYPPAVEPSGVTLVYGDIEGTPMVSTDESGYVTSFEYVDVSEENPVAFNGDSEMDTHFLPFKNAKDFEIIFHCKAKQEEQTYRGIVDGVNWDHLANILEFKLERTNYEGVGLRFAQHTADYLALNYRKSTDTKSTNYQLEPRSDEHTDEWNFRFVYQGNRFTVYDRFTGQILKDKDGKSIDFTNQTFGDIDDLTLCVGAAFDHNSGTFFRFGKCDVYEFSVRKL